MNLLTRLRNLRTSTIVIILAVLFGLDCLCYYVYGFGIVWGRVIRVSISIGIKGSM